MEAGSGVTQSEGGRNDHTPKNIDSHSKLQKRQGNKFSPRASEGARPANTLSLSPGKWISDF